MSEESQSDTVSLMSVQTRGFYVSAGALLKEYVVLATPRENGRTATTI